MSKTKYFALAFAAALAITGTLGTNAYAQAYAQAPAPATNPTSINEQGGQLQQITVTGYIIPRVGEGPQPVTTLDQDYISKTGYQTVTDVLQQLPSTAGNFSPATTTGNSFSPASASISLHGLNPNFTLVLVDGKRMPAFPFPQVSVSAVISFVDLNSIPLAAIDRIEILNDGGSAVYGSDAVAGVVNVITKQEYNGADITQYWGISEHGDAETYHGSLVAGVSHKLWSDDSKLSIVAAFDYFEQGPIDAADRPYSANPDHSVYSPRYPAIPFLFPTNGSFTGLNSGSAYQVARGTRPANGVLTSGNIVPAPVNNNFSPNYWQILAREQRYGGIVNLNLDVTQNLKFYDQLLVQRNEESSETPNQGFSSGDIDPGQLPGATVAPVRGFPASFIIPTNNTFNQTGEPLIPNFPGMYLPEMGAWNTHTIIRTIRNVVGATLQLPHDWVIDANFQYAESDGTETVFNSTKKDALTLALAGQLPGHVGQFFNPFIDERFAGNFNQQFYDALRTQQWEDIRTSVLTWHISAGGTLIDLCSGPVTVAGGLEYRSEELIQNQDINSKFGNITSNDFASGHLTTGRRWVHSGFIDLEIPLFGDKWSWPGARSLQLSIQERYDDYSTFGSAAKPKFAIAYKPFDDLTIRGSYDEGFAAPALAELFGTPIPAQTSVNDPHFGGQSFTVLSFTGGNPRLKPENSYMYYIGGLWTPGAKDPEHSWWGWVNGFSAYVDWWQVNVRNLIGNVTPQILVDLEGAFPGAVIRNSAGQITQINATFQNLGDELYDGWDFGASYVTKQYFWGKLDLEFNATYYQNWSVRQFIGANPNGTPRFQVWDQTDSWTFPDFKSVGSAFYSKTVFGVDTFRTGLTLRFVDSQHDINDNFKGTNPTATLDPGGRVHRVGDWTTLDWQISYKFGAPAEINPETPKPGYNKEGKRVLGEQAIAPKPEGSTWGWRSLLANTTFTFGINNVFNTRPPFSADWYQGYDTSNATPYGRFYYMEFEKKF
jgi:iron complex outermembrane recepter protein